MTTTSATISDFEELLANACGQPQPCGEQSAADALYKQLFAEYDVQWGSPTYQALSEAHRRSLELLSQRTKQAEQEAESLQSGEAQAQVVRRWAREQGIELKPRGAVPTEVSNLFRAAHDLPLIETITVPAADVRRWALENDIEVPSRGRLPQSVVEGYKAAQIAAEATEEEN